MDVRVWISFAIVVYLFPTIIAVLREKDNWLAILFLNVLAGWTFFGWVGALVWAATTNGPSKQRSETE